MTGGISQDLNEKSGTLNENIPIIGGKGLGDVYGLGTSIAQSALAGYTGGSVGTLVQFFGSAAASGVDDALARGATEEQAMTLGTLLGLAEAIPEMLGVESLLQIGASSTMRELMEVLIKQGAAEGLEEGMTTLMSNFADQLVMLDKSNFSLLVEQYMTNGLPEEVAKKQAWLDMAEDLAYDMLGGFVSGSVHAGPQTAYQTVVQNAQAKQIYGKNADGLVGKALEADQGNAFAQKMQGRLDSGKNLSGGQMSRLARETETAVRAQDVSAIQSAAAKRLTELGERGNVAAVSAALAKQAAGQELSRAEQQAISKSQYGRRVANELDAYNIRSGRYSSEWAQQIGTKRINAEEYSRMLESAQTAQEDANIAEPQAAAESQNEPQAVEAPAVEAPTATAEVQQESKAVTEESPATVEDAQEESTVRLEDVSKKYGAQAGAMVRTYNVGGGKQNVEKYDAAYERAYDMGRSGVSLSYAMNSTATSYLTEKQRELAYEAGTAAADTAAKEHQAKNEAAATGKTGRKVGVVKGEGVTIGDLKKTFNDTQNTAYKLLSTYAEATGIDIVLYKSEADATGDFQGAQGRYSRSEPGTIYIDINAGLANIKSVDDLAKYAMLRTFAHEFVHFIENWNPVQYNEFRRVVFDTLAQRGENVEFLIEQKQQGGLSYEKASREVVAEAMTDILPDANFVETLANKHKTIFDKLLAKLKEFVAQLRAYYNSIGKNRSREANALKEQVGDAVRYVENIVQLFDHVAVQAVENYQKTVATEEAAIEAKAEAVAKKYGLTEDEVSALFSYKTGSSYALNGKLTEKKELDEYQTWMRDNLDTGLEKLPVVTGTVYRHYDFDELGGRDALLAFLGQFRRDKRTNLGGYLSASTVPNEDRTDGAYTVDMVIESQTARSFDGFGENTENEVLFPRTVDLVPVRMEKTTGYKIKMIMREATTNGEGAADDPEADKVQHLREGTQDGADLRGIPERNPEEVREEAGRGSGRSAGVSGLRAGERSGPVDRSGVAEDHGGTEIGASAGRGVTPSEKLADLVLRNYINEENINQGRKMLTSRLLYALADEAFGGTQAEGAYDRKDAYDAMELAVNKFLLQYAAKANKTFNGTATSAVSAVEFMEDMLELLPTQSVRTQEQQDYQQFSTPPNIAYLAAWAANISSNDMVLEPSAGIGGLAVFAKAWGAEVAVNELSKRRLEVLRAMGFDHLFNENAEQIDNILPDNIAPSVVIMNPPFSSTAGRTANNKTSNAEVHLNQALERLQDGGRLVAVLGKSMNDQDYYRYWDKVRKSYNIRANLSIDGSNYKKYGTTWGVQIVVIDKTGPQTGETVTGRFTDLTEVPKVLEGIRNDRSNVEANRAGSSNDSIRESVVDGGNGQSRAGHDGSNQRTAGSSSVNQRKENRKGSEGAERAGNRADGKGPAETGSAQTERQDGGTDRTAGRTDPGNGHGAVESGTVDRYQPELSPAQLSETEEVSDDGVYATFVLPEMPVKGGKKHPAVLVESAAMAAVSMPKATYKPKLPADVVRNNLSDAQMVTVTYAGQAHEQKLPDGRRKGFFIGDGTGVGKGRQIAGIILDNFMQGRTKAVWISKNDDLFGDAIRDWTATTGRNKDEVVSQGKFKPKDKITLKSGILFTSYGKLKMEKGGNRLEQIVEWLGEDFDGVIAFDEAHHMGNLFGKKGKFGKSKGSLTAKAGVELQRRLPNARIVYVSATAATEVDNLAYAERIGLWGQGTAFSTAQDFISKIGASGLAAMELVIRDMKAMGTYVARSISYNGVNYDTVEHALDPMQTEIYNTMSRAWQKTMQNVQSALETTGGQYNSTERQKALGNFYSAMQRFYNQVLTSMSMPSVIADIRRELAAGHSAVLQIVNTNEAQQNKQLAEAKATGESLDNLDLTPREALLGYLTTSFPTQMFEEYTDDDGNLRSRPVMDSAGNPVQNKAAIKQRDALIAEVNQMSIPDGPLEMLFDAFGPEAVAENTGRSRRVVPRKQADGTISRVEERRTLNHRTADVQAFQDGKKRILVFSDAGGTGKSYHADRSEKNQQLRVHYVLQPGWVASNAVQGFGRTHRSNEALPPVYKLVTTNIKGQKRFTSTIARRLDQLGALTKGQRDTGSGMFGAKDNLETDLAKDSLREFYRRLGKNLIEDIDGMKVLDRLGLKQKFTDEYGAFKLNDNLARDIGTFLNRILALEVDEQNVVFDAFISIYEMELEAAIQAGTLDTGMENVKADRIEVVDDKVIREDKNTGAATHYIQAKTYTKPKVVTTVAEMEKRRSGFEGIYRTESGAVKAVYRIADKTTEWGAIQKQYRLVGPNQGAKNSVWGETTLQTKAEAIDKADWQKEWDAEVKKVPEYNEDTLHMLTGALLPIWNSLPQEGNTKVKRLIAHDGTAYLGRVIDKDDIDGVLKGFSIGRTVEVFTAQQVMDKALDNGIHFYLTNDKAQIFRSRVSGQWRLEITQPYNSWYLTRRYPGIMQERISYRDRYFIPVGEKGLPILEKLLADNPVRNTADDTEQYQSRTDTLTDRDVLEEASKKVAIMTDLSDAERDALKIFQDRLAKLQSLQEERVEQGRLYKEQQFGANVDRAAAAETLNRMHVLDARIRKAGEEVLDVEKKTVLRRVLQKARVVVEQQERQKGDEKLKRWRDRRNDAAAVKKYRDRIRGDVDELKNWVLHPDNKSVVNHIPDALKDTVLPFLSSINFMSKQQLRGGSATVADNAFMQQLSRLESVMNKTVGVDEMYSNYTDLPPDFMQNLRDFIEAAQSIANNSNGEFIINQMTADELRKLSKVVRALKTYIKKFNYFHVNAMFKHVYDAGENSIEFLSHLNPAENTGKVSEFLLWKQMRPAYAFERFGEGGEAIYDGLRRGQAKLAFNTKEIQAFAAKAYTEADVRNWEKDVKTINLGGGESVKMRVSQIMSLYELSKRKQALGHILGGGIRVATFKNGRNKISDNGHTLTERELNTIIGTLTPRQMEVADKLQQYMEKQGGEWGNHVSVARFGERQFGEEHYFPINSDGRHLQVNADEKPGAAALYALLNMGFTKQLQEEASNRIVVYSIFDVFANHMASMAQYNALALPVVDALKWFNYKRIVINEDGSKSVLGSVREQMNRAYGVPEELRPGSKIPGYAESFIINIIKAFNGTEAQGAPLDSWGLQTLHRYNRAQVAYNFRVVVQQPLAITRAAMLLDYTSIIKGMKLAPAAIEKNIQEMQKYSGIAAWKSLGFYDVNISRGLTSLIKHDNTMMDKITDVGMWGAEKADLMTWAAMWSASKEEVIRKQKLNPKDDGYYEAVTKLFEDVIYKTQVVDSVLTKNEFMRDKGFWARAVGSFMSEPTTTASMLVDAFDKYQMDMQRGMTRQQAWKKNGHMIGRLAYVYGLGAVLLAAVQAVADAFRDDDDYQTFLEKWLEAFGGNVVDELMPLNKLPIVSDFYEVMKEVIATWTGWDTYGNAPQSVLMQWYDSLVKGMEILHDKVYGEDTNYTWYGGAYKLLQAASGMTGAPMAAATREFVTLHNNAIVPLWNSTIGAMAPSLKVDKVKTYEPSAQAQIKYAYQDGYLSAEEATEQLLAQGLVDSENEAYWTIQGWDDPDGSYSRYDAIYDVVRNGGDFNAAMQELTSHGYTEKDVRSRIKGKVGEWYKGGEITKQQATQMLTRYSGMESSNITDTVNKWSSKVVTGIDYEDIGDEYKAGNITAARAKQMYKLYGGMTEERASEKVAVLEFAKEYPDYDDISYAAVESYRTYGEPAGVPVGTFYDAWKYNSNTDADVDANGNSISGSKKTKVLNYIDGLNLTYQQKDSLYYAFGWAESKIYEAPWH